MAKPWRNELQAQGLRLLSEHPLDRAEIWTDEHFDLILFYDENDNVLSLDIDGLHIDRKEAKPCEY